MKKMKVSVELLYERMGQLSMTIFPDATFKDHLTKLKIEADEAMDGDVEEFADCLLVLFGAVYKAGHSFEKLMSEANFKYVINSRRKWEKLPDGTYQHIKTESDE